MATTGSARRPTLDDIPASPRRAAPRYRLHQQAKPHYAMAGLTLAGATVHAISTATGEPATVAAAVALIVVVATVASRKLRRRWRAFLAAAGWLAWVAASGLDWTTFAAMATTGYLLALRHWRQHRIPNPPLVEPEPEPEPTQSNTPPQLWEEHVASSGGPLPGSYLTGRQEISTGERYQLHLVPARQTLGGALGKLTELKGGLFLRPGQDLVIEEDPETHVSTVRLTIVQRPTVTLSDQPWPGPTFDSVTGMIDLGPYVDGELTASWSLVAPNRLRGGYLAGSTGSGKSRLLEAIALGAAAADCAVWFADPQGGASSPFLMRHADWSARGHDGVLKMLQHARKIKELRQVENDYHEWEGWRPEQGRRGLVIIVDECHSPMAVAKILALADEMAREGGKVGVALVFASQVLTLDAFGNLDSLRSSICAGNVVLMRINSSNVKGIIPGIHVDPGTFPQIPGYGWLIDSTGTRRSAPFRGYYLDNPARDRAGREVAWPELDQRSASAAGYEYISRREKAVVDKAAQKELLERLARGEQVIYESSPSRPDPRPRMALETPAAAPDFPAPEAAADSLAEPGRRTAVEATWELIASGVTGPGEIQTRTGYSETAVRNALRELADAGRAHNPRHGVWEPIRQEAPA
jgi:hypothetical protein